MVKAYEIPTKKNVDRKVIEAALDEHVELSSFTIELEDGRRRKHFRASLQRNS